MNNVAQVTHDVRYGLSSKYHVSPSTWRDYAIMRLCEEGYGDGYNPHNVRAWLIGHEFGIVAVGIGSCEQVALDDAADLGLLGCIAITEEDAAELELDGCEPLRLGNASEPFHSEYLWIEVVE